MLAERECVAMEKQPLKMIKNMTSIRRNPMLSRIRGFREE